MMGDEEGERKWVGEAKKKRAWGTGGEPLHDGECGAIKDWCKGARRYRVGRGTRR